MLSAWGTNKEDNKKAFLDISFSTDTKLLMNLRFETPATQGSQKRDKQSETKQLSFVINHPSFLVEAHCNENRFGFVLKYNKGMNSDAKYLSKDGKNSVTEVVLSVAETDKTMKWIEFRAPKEIDEDYKIIAVCDGKTFIYVDGKPMNSPNSKWYQKETVSVAASFRNIIIDCHGEHTETKLIKGILAQVQDAIGRDILVTDNSWWCANYNGPHYQPAAVLGDEVDSKFIGDRKSISSNAKIISTSAATANKVRCGKTLGALSKIPTGYQGLSLKCGKTVLFKNPGNVHKSKSNPGDNDESNSNNKDNDEFMETITALKKVSCYEVEGTPVIKGVLAVVDKSDKTKLHIKKSWTCTTNVADKAKQDIKDIMSTYKCTESYNEQTECSPGTKSVIDVVGDQSCVACVSSRRQYQPELGQTICKICYGKVNDKATKCTPEYCDKNSATNEKDGKQYEFEKKEAYTFGSVECAQGGHVYRYCNGGGIWSDTVLDYCWTENTEKFNDIKESSGKEELNPTNATKITNSLKVIISEKNSNTAISQRDFSDMLDVLGNVGGKLPVSNSKEYNELRKKMAASMEYVLKADPQQMNDTNKNKVNNVVESITASLPENSPPIETENLAITALKPDKAVDLLGPKNTDSLQFDAGDDMGKRVNVAVMSKSYRQFLPVPDGNNTIDSAIISINFVNKSEKRNFSLKFELDDRRNRTCAYLDSKTGHWKTDGVTTVNNNDRTHTCVSNHATSFAIILSIDDIDEKQARAQEGLSYFMFFINLLFLSLTFGLVAPFRKLRKKILTMVQLNIIFALILGNVGFNVLSLTTKVNVDSRNFPVDSLNRGCIAGIIIVQYFFLAAMFWMGSSAWILYGKIVDAVRNHGRSEKHFLRNHSILCWGVSALFPLAVYLAAWSLTERTTDYKSPYLGGNVTQGADCWIASPWKYPSFMVPIWIILLFDTACFIMISRVIVGAAKTPNSEARQIAKITKGMIAVSTSVGLPWVVSAFTFNPLATAAQYLFIILVGLQGPFLFVSMICLQDDTKEHTIDLLGLRKFFPKQFKKHVEQESRATTENTTATYTVTNVLSKTEESQATAENNTYTEAETVVLRKTEIVEIKTPEEQEEEEYRRKTVGNLTSMFESKAEEDEESKRTADGGQSPFADEKKNELNKTENDGVNKIEENGETNQREESEILKESQSVGEGTEKEVDDKETIEAQETVGKPVNL